MQEERRKKNWVSRVREAHGLSPFFPGVRMTRGERITVILVGVVSVGIGVGAYLVWHYRTSPWDRIHVDERARAVLDAVMPDEDAPTQELVFNPTVNNDRVELGTVEDVSDGSTWIVILDDTYGSWVDVWIARKLPDGSSEEPLFAGTLLSTREETAGFRRGSLGRDFEERIEATISEGVFTASVRPPLAGLWYELEATATSATWTWPRTMVIRSWWCGRRPRGRFPCAIHGG